MTAADHSRHNGRRSRGPITAEGKRRSSRNSIKHGILAVQHHPEGESEEKRTQLIKAVMDRLQPQCPVEYASSFTLAMDSVRLQRLEAAHEAAVVDAQKKALEEETQNSQEISELRMEIEGWEMVRKSLDVLNGDPRKLGRLLPVFCELVDASTHTAEGLKMYCGQVKRAVMGGVPAVDIIARVRDLCVKQLEHLRDIEAELLAQQNEARMLRIMAALIPEEHMIKKLSRYRASIERGMLRQVSILKGLRELEVALPGAGGR